MARKSTVLATRIIFIFLQQYQNSHAAVKICKQHLRKMIVTDT